MTCHVKEGQLLLVGEYSHHTLLPFQVVVSLAVTLQALCTTQKHCNLKQRKKQNEPAVSNLY